MDDDLLISEDISGLAPGQTRTVSRQITLPISVFKFCGYDAVTIVLNDENGAVLQQSDHNFIELSEPMNISLNNGRALSLNANENKKAELKYDSTVFMDKNGKVSYESSDPTVLSVDEKGVMTGLSAGSAKLTATIMPSGRTAEIDVTVNGSGSSSGGSSGGGSSASGAAGAVTPAKPNADGTTTTTTNNPDGGKTETTKKTDGTSVAVTTDRNGSVKSVEATVSAKAAEEAAKTGDAVILPVNITQGTQIRVDIPDGQTVDMAVPTTNAKTSTVVYIVKADGTEELLKDCDVQNGIISAKIDSDCTLVLRDNEKKFSDVEKDRWSYDAINFVTSREIFNGNGDGTFEPFETVSRGMMTQVLFNLDRNARPAVSNFTDSDELLWFADAVGWAAGMGIVNGNEDGSFGVNDPLQREQCVTMLFRYAKLIGLDTSKRTSLAAFPDEGSVREYSSEAMQWAVAVGLINGDDGMLKPEGGCDREQLAAMITRFVKLMH